MPPSPSNCPKCNRALLNGRDCVCGEQSGVTVLDSGEQSAPWLDKTQPATQVLPKGEAPPPASENSLPPDPLIGATVGDYVIHEVIGRGGMGVVYKGEQPIIGKRVAVKVLRADLASDDNQVRRLIAEARAVNAIRHRGIIDIFTVGKLPDGRHYVVMEYLSGESLDLTIHRRGAIPVLETIDILDQILSALAAGHGAGIIHRDLKPSNLFTIEEPGGARYIKILDFGLAKQRETEGTSITGVNLVVGTPEYMAPEQARAEPVTPQSDLYAVGVIAFELLTGRLPFEATSAYDLMIKQVNDPPPSPSQFTRNLPRDLEKLILKLLEKDPGRRPPSAAAVRDELLRIKSSLVGPLRRDEEKTVVKTDPPKPPAPRRTAWPILAALAGALCAGLLTLLVAKLFFTPQQPAVTKVDLSPKPVVQSPPDTVPKVEPEPDPLPPQEQGTDEAEELALDPVPEEEPTLKDDPPPPLTRTQLAEKAKLHVQIAKLEARVKEHPGSLAIRRADADAAIVRLREEFVTVKTGEDLARVTRLFHSTRKTLFPK